MQARGFAALGAVLAGSMVGLAVPAAAAPSGPGNAEDAVTELESSGVVVIVQPRTSAPLDRSTVLSVRPGENYRPLGGNLVYLDVG